MLKGKTVLVTGAGRGIGRATALAFASEGCKVACVARSGDQVEQTVELVHKAGGEGLALIGDVADEHSVADFMSAAVCHLGDIDVLVNNAGVFAVKPLAETTVEDWDLTMGVNARGVFLCIKAVLPGMISRREGCIVNIASMASLKPYPNQGAYVASKHAVLGLSKVLADEMRPHGVRVTAICPGGVNTDLVRTQRPDWEPEMLMGPDDVAQCAVYVAKLSPRAAIDVIPMRRWPAAPM